MEKLLSIQEAADLLRLAPDTLYKYTCYQKIPHIKLGSRVLFKAEELESWVHEHFVAPIAP